MVVAALATSARANTRIVVMTDADDASAMQVALAGRGTEIAAVAPPEGALRLDRAASVQRSAMDAHAVAGVWIEQEPGNAEVCVVSADGHVFRHAPLPIDATTPRVFAAIALSLLDELLSPQDISVNVDVHVDVNGTPVQGTATINGAAIAPSAPTAPTPVVAVPVAPAPLVAMTAGPYALGVAPPGLVETAQPDLSSRAHRTLIEIGPMITPASFGVEGEVAFPLGPQWRFGVEGFINTLFVDNWRPLGGAGVELRRCGLGRRHFDIGFGGGGAFADSIGVGYTNVRLGMTWEGPSTGFNVSLVPVLVFTNDGADPVVPSIFAAAKWQFAI